MLLEKHLQLAIRAHNGTSHVPEQRGAYYIRAYSEQLTADMDKVQGLGGDPEDYRQRYERYFVNWLSAKSRCLSSMITGPSGFPVRQAQKANESERKRSEEFVNFRERYMERLARAQRRAQRAESDPVADLRRKIEGAERDQEIMKAANKIVQAKNGSAAEKVQRLVTELHMREGNATQLLQPDYMGRVGFASYLLTNNLANIKRMRERLAELERKAATASTETARPDGIRIVENTEMDRLQVYFPGKPDADTIGRLKSNAFKWSPSQGCWQRHLTDNARTSLRRVLPVPAGAAE